MTALNPDSLRKAVEAYTEAAGTPARWCNVTMRTVGSLSYNPNAGIEAAILAYLAAEAERGMAMRPRAPSAEMVLAALDRPYAANRTMYELIWSAMWDAGAPT